MTDLRQQLQTTLGSAYTLDRELGGGGMSRVFVAHETALGRQVVVKVLPPELAAGVSTERFKREIQVAARLQHPHIVPVLSAGESDGLPFYTMPLVDGSSLRARLARGGLAIGEAVSILREVARALAYAHAHGVVHRDIKPDNVLLTGGSAVVTDFGIAKALSAARTGGDSGVTLTQMGTSLGTPAYMAPEQAAADPSADHRVDLYAYGVMAYELLTGHTPFHGLSPHKLLAAHMGETPKPVAELRSDVPPVLAEVVMRCLAKDPDARPQSAADLARVLDTVTISASGQTGAPPVLLAGRGMLGKALALYVGAFVVVAVLARAAIVSIGLPDWVFPGALIVMALGLPVILFTAFVHKQAHRAFTTTPALTPGGSPSQQGTLLTMAVKAAPHVSWRRTAMGGGIAVGAFVVLVGGWMLLRALGIGPAGSLMAAGAMGDRERVVLADFSGTTNDSLLPATITEAFRTDLAQSPNLSVMPALALREVLRRMQRPTDAPVDFTLAREIATREGIKAVVDGNVTELGGSYVIAARLVSAQTGEEMATFRETAAEEKEIIPAIGRLSRKLRSKVGESLRGIQQAPALDQVSTASLPALQKYVAGNRAILIEGDFAKGMRLLEEAVALDTTFSMAYRRLAVELNNRQIDPARARAMLQKAYDHRDRLSDGERYLLLGTYWTNGPAPDRARAIASYESLIDLQPDNTAALNNLASLYMQDRQFAKAEETTRRGLEADETSPNLHTNLVWIQQAQGRLAAAESSTVRMAEHLPRNPATTYLRAGVMLQRGRYDSAHAVLDSLVRARPGDLGVRYEATATLAAIAGTRGRMRDMLRWSHETYQAGYQAGSRADPLHEALDEAEVEVWFHERRERALDVLERALARHPLDSIPPLERPYDRLAKLYALAGRPDRAREAAAALDRRVAESSTPNDARRQHASRAYIAIAERRYDDAAREFRASDEGPCTGCALPELAMAYDLAGSEDSAVAVFARYVESPSHPARNWFVDHLNLAGAHKRLGELYETRGDRQKAASHYAKFVELWTDADPELQPKVREVRARLAALQRAERP